MWLQNHNLVRGRNNAFSYLLWSYRFILKWLNCRHWFRMSCQNKCLKWKVSWLVFQITFYVIYVHLCLLILVQKFPENTLNHSQKYQLSYLAEVNITALIISSIPTCETDTQIYHKLQYNAKIGDIFLLINITQWLAWLKDYVNFEEFIVLFLKYFHLCDIIYSLEHLLELVGIGVLIPHGNCIFMKPLTTKYYLS